MISPSSDSNLPDSEHEDFLEPEGLEEDIPRRGTLKREVWNIVSTHGRGDGGIRKKEIAEKLGKPSTSVRSTLAQLEQRA